MKETIRQMIELKYKTKEQISLWSKLSQDLQREEKVLMIRALMAEGIFGYLDCLSEILFDVLELDSSYVLLLEEIYGKIKNDLASGPFYNMLIKIGETYSDPIEFFEFIQINSKNMDFKIISGLILGGMANTKEMEVINYVKNSLNKSNLERTLAFVRVFLVIYKDKEIPAVSKEILSLLFDSTERKLFPDLMNLATVSFNQNKDFFLSKIFRMVKMNDDGINVTLFRNLIFRDLDISDHELLSFIDLAKDSNEYVLDEILHVLNNRSLFNNRIGDLFLYWLNKDIEPRNFDWVLEELSKKTDDIIKYFFNNYDKIRLYQVRFPHLIHSFIRANVATVTGETIKLLNNENEQFVLSLLREIIGFIYRFNKYGSLLCDIYMVLSELARGRGYIDDTLSAKVDRSDFTDKYDLYMDRVSSLITQMQTRQKEYDFQKITSNIRKYPYLFSYVEELIKYCETNKAYSPILWLGEREEPEIPKQKETGSLMVDALNQSYVRSLFWPRAYLHELNLVFNIFDKMPNVKYQHLDAEKKKKILLNRFKEEKSFWDYFSELCFVRRLYDSDMLNSLEPERNKKQLDALIKLDNKNIFVEITNPKMERSIRLDFGAVSIGNKSLDVIQRKLHQAYKFLSGDDYLILAIDISSSTIDEYGIINALYGSLGLTLQFDKDGRFMNEFPSRSDDSIAKRFKNHELLSAIVIFKRAFAFDDDWSPRIVLQGNIYENPKAKNKLTKDELTRLGKTIFS